MRTLQPHGYIGDGLRDVNETDRCVFCGLAEARTDVHPEITNPSAELDARMVGEAYEEAPDGT